MKIYKKTVLPNGVRVVTETHSRARAVSVGIWVLTGTRQEPQGLTGISHFLEHLVFKGTKKRSGFQIAWDIESLGGEINAYTSRENTSYQCLVLKKHWPIALDVLCDLVSNFQLKTKDFKTEKSVILQEIAMVEENHEEHIYDLFHQDLYQGNPLAEPILGKISTIAKMQVKDLRKYHHSYYTGPNLIVSICGGVKHAEAVQWVQKKLKVSKTELHFSNTQPGWNTFRKVYEKPSEQVHILIGLPATSFKDKDRYCATILNAYLGGGMTSQLFQNVREQKGLVYTIHSSLNTYTDCGALLIYAATDFENVKTVVGLIVSTLKKIKKQGFYKKTLEMYKTQIVGSLWLNSDDLESRMSSLAVNEMVFSKHRDIQNIIHDIEKVTVEEMNTYIDSKINLEQLSGILLGRKVKNLSNWWKNYL